MQTKALMFTITCVASALYACETRDMPSSGPQAAPGASSLPATGNTANAGQAKALSNQITLGANPAELPKELQTALIQAPDHAVITLPAGTFVLTRSLTLSGKQGITLRGAGMDKTILSFAGQKSGAEGIKVTANGFTIEDLTIQDTKGDGIKIEKSKDVTIRRVKTEWTGGPNTKNGAYGLYPVQCENVLIEESVAIGASDAGIYVGQSKTIVVRNNRAEYNVAGIEIENSQRADVYGNTVTNNTGGILVFDLPDLDVMGGRDTRLFQNTVVNNNTANFAPAGNIVATVPAGTGIMLMATDDVEVFENKIMGHQTLNMAIVSYHISGKPIDSSKAQNQHYDPYPEGIHVHDNTFADGGKNPQGLLAHALAAQLGKPLPDIVYDGNADQKKLVDGALPEKQRICLMNNSAATFANLDAGNNLKNLSRDLGPHTCSLPSLKPVELPQRGSQQ